MIIMYYGSPFISYDVAFINKHLLLLFVAVILILHFLETLYDYGYYFTYV